MRAFLLQQKWQLEAKAKKEVHVNELLGPNISHRTHSELAEQFMLSPNHYAAHYGPCL